MLLGSEIREGGMKLPLACACLLLLTACNGPGPGITGNDTGGIIPYPLVASHGGSDRAVARAMASEHCARYRKFAVITSIHRKYGDYVAFVCKWNLSRPGPG
jgi:hypothetical protein